MLDSQWIPGWWLNQPLWKILVKLEVFPNFRAENKKCLKPPTSLLWVLRARFPMNSVFSTRKPSYRKMVLTPPVGEGFRSRPPGPPGTPEVRDGCGFPSCNKSGSDLKKEVQVGSCYGWNLKIHGWSTYPPRVPVPLPRNMALWWGRAYENHWFPLNKAGY